MSIWAGKLGVKEMDKLEGHQGLGRSGCVEQRKAKDCGRQQWNLRGIDGLGVKANWMKA